MGVQTEVAKTVPKYNGIVDILKQSGWVFKGNGFWLDPISGKRYLTSDAIKMASVRKSK